MIIPVRCFSCGKPVASLWQKYQKLIEEGKSVKDALDELELKRFCCRGTLMSHVDSIDVIGAYN